MKKKLFTILLCGGLLACLTGCGAEKELSSIPNDFQGVYLGSVYKDDIPGVSLVAYYVYKIEGNTMKRKICFIGNGETAKDCNFEDGKKGLYETAIYNIKEIKKIDDENVSFNNYDGEDKYSECKTSFGRVTCTTNNGTSLSLSKQN